MDEEDLSLLEQLAQNGFAKRTGFSPAQLSSQREIVNQRVKDANTPASYSLRDALMSAIVQATPGLIGAAIAGKRGAQAGLEGGLEGGKMFKQLTEDNFEAKRKTNSILAQEALQELQQMRKTNLSADEANLKNVDALAMQRIKQSDKEKLKRMGGGLEGGLNNLAKAIMESKSPSPEMTSDQGSQPAGRTLLDDYQEGKITKEDAVGRFIPNATPEQIQLFLSDPRMMKLLQDTFKNEGSLLKIEQSLKKGELDIEDKKAGMQEKEKEIRAKSKVLPMGNMAFIPDSILKEDLPTARLLTSNYHQAISSIGALIRENSKGGMARAFDQDTKATMEALRNEAVQAISRLENTDIEKSNGSSGIAKELAEKAIPQLAGVRSALGDAFKAAIQVGNPIDKKTLSALYTSLQKTGRDRLAGMGGNVISSDKIRVNPNDPTNINEYEYFINGKWVSGVGE
jgi:hypothetical protein